MNQEAERNANRATLPWHGTRSVSGGDCSRQKDFLVIGEQTALPVERLRRNQEGFQRAACQISPLADWAMGCKLRMPPLSCSRLAGILTHLL